MPGSEGLGGVVPAANAPSGPVAGIGVQPGTSSRIVASQVIIIGTGGQLLVYSPTAGAGNLITSISGSATTDTYGDAVPQGVQVGASSQPQIVLVPGGTAANPGAAEVQFPIPASSASLSNIPNIGAGVASGAAQLIASGPALSTAGDKDWVQIQMTSNNAAGTNATCYFNYINTSGVAGVIAFFSLGGWTFGAAIPVTVEGNLTVDGSLTVFSGASISGGLTVDTINGSGSTGGPDSTGFFNTQGLASGSYGSTHQHTLPNFPTATHGHPI
jgi:hypothetical protein